MKGLSVYQLTLGLAKSVTMEQVYTWDKVDGSDSIEDPIRGAERCT